MQKSTGQSSACAELCFPRTKKSAQTITNNNKSLFFILPPVVSDWLSTCAKLIGQRPSFDLIYTPQRHEAAEEMKCRRNEMPKSSRSIEIGNPGHVPASSPVTNAKNEKVFHARLCPLCDA